MVTTILFTLGIIFCITGAITMIYIVNKKDISFNKETILLYLTIFSFILSIFFSALFVRQTLIDNIGSKNAFIMPTYQIQTNPTTGKADTVNIKYKLVKPKNTHKYVIDNWDK